MQLASKQWILDEVEFRSAQMHTAKVTPVLFGAIVTSLSVHAIRCSSSRISYWNICMHINEQKRKYECVCEADWERERERERKKTNNKKKQRNTSSCWSKWNNVHKIHLVNNAKSQRLATTTIWEMKPAMKMRDNQMQYDGNFRTTIISARSSFML